MTPCRYAAVSAALQLPLQVREDQIQEIWIPSSTPAKPKSGSLLERVRSRSVASKQGLGGGQSRRIAAGDFTVGQSCQVARSNGTYSDGWIKGFDSSTGLYLVHVNGAGEKYVDAEQISLL